MPTQPVVAVVNTNLQRPAIRDHNAERGRRPAADRKDERVYEVLDDRADTDTIVQAVREAARARPTA